jgi:hypothetical protein
MDTFRGTCWRRLPLLFGLLGHAAPAQAAWTEVATLTHPTATAEERTWFGQAVACSGAQILVGAGFENDSAGAVYAFSGDGFGTVVRIAPPAEADLSFGTQLSLSGDTAGIGTIKIDGGHVHFFRLGSAGWSLESSFAPALGMPAYAGSFGRPTLVRGDWAAVGSPKESGDTGRVYIYRRSAGVWTEQAQLAASDERMGNFFGLPLAFDGDTAVVGAGRNAGDPDEYNAVYVFERDGDTWSEQARLDILDQPVRHPDIRFGIYVALAGDTLAVGAPDKGDDGIAQGRVFIYDRSNGAWTLSELLVAETGQEYFGSDIAAQRDALVVSGREGEASILYTYRKIDGAWIQTSTLTSKEGESEIALCGPVLVRGGDLFATVYRDAELEGTDSTTGPVGQSPGGASSSGGAATSNPPAQGAAPGHASAEDEGGCTVAPGRSRGAPMALLGLSLLICLGAQRRRRPVELRHLSMELARAAPRPAAAAGGWTATSVAVASAPSIRISDRT